MDYTSVGNLLELLDHLQEIDCENHIVVTREIAKQLLLIKDATNELKQSMNEGECCLSKSEFYLDFLKIRNDSWIKICKKHITTHKEIVKTECRDEISLIKKLEPLVLGL